MTDRVGAAGPEAGGDAPVWEGQFRMFLAARTASLVATTMAPIAVTFAVLYAEFNAHGLAVVTTVRTVAMLLVLPAAGVLADRLSPRLLLVSSHAIAAASQAAAAILIASGSATVTSIALLEAVNGAANAITLPVFTSVVTVFVAKEHLVRANSLIGMARSATTIGGPVLASVAIATANPAAALALNAAFFAAAGAMCLRLRFPGSATPIVRTSFLRDAREGWSDFASRPWVWTVVLAFFIINAAFTGVQSVIGPLTAVESDLGQLGWGLAIGAMGAGMAVGGVLSYRTRPKRPLALGLLCAAGLAAPAAALWLEPSLVPVASAFFIAGIGMEIFTIYWLTSLQANIRPDRLGRMSTFDALGSYAAIPIGASLAGILAPRYGDVLLPAAAVCILGAALLPLAARSVRQLEAMETPATSLKGPQ